MPFDKGYFDSLNQTLVGYEQAAKPRSGITVTAHLVTNVQYRVASIVQVTDSVVSFLFYEKDTKAGDVLPMVSVPYSVIAVIHVEPAAAKSKFGFEHRSS
jgi:hypothetical protein